MADLSHLLGWLGTDEIQQTFAAEFPGLAQAAPHLMEASPSTEPVLLYKAWRDLLGKDPDYPAQTIGECVSFSHAHGNDLLQAIEIGLGEPLAYQETDSEFIYGTSREIAGILGPRDGSYGSAAVKAMMTIGMLSRKMLGPDGAYSGKRSKAWGWHGVPARLKKEAAAFKLGGAVKVTTWDELVAAQRSLYPTTISTSNGFNLKRDADGFCKQQKCWPPSVGCGGHSMLIAGLRFDRPGACIIQSWGPDTPSGPLALGQPTFSFWADRPAIERILAEGDSWALSRSPAFEKRDLPPHWKYSDVA